MSLELLRRLFTVEEERQMEAGIFTEDDRGELIGGEIVEMAPIGRRHAACVRRLVVQRAPWRTHDTLSPKSC